MKIEAWLREATQQLTEVGIPSARLDSLILLEVILHKERPFILAHGEEALNETQINNLDKLLRLRLRRQPLAYLRGHSEFFGRKFIVDTRVLIPRPETEIMVDQVLQLELPKAPRIADIGTGSGVVAISLALELLNAVVSGYDKSLAALTVARQNAKQLQAAVVFEVSDLLSNAPSGFDVIAANLPYVANDKVVSPEVVFEPADAIYSGVDGLDAIRTLLLQTPTHLKADGYLLLEADLNQHSDVIDLAKHQRLTLLTKEGLILVFKLAK